MELSIRRAAALAATLALGACAATSGEEPQQALARQYPPQARYCAVSSHGLPNSATAIVDGHQATLSAALVIRDQSNRVVVNSQLPQSFQAMCATGPGGSLEKLWLLTPEQARAARAASRGAR